MIRIKDVAKVIDGFAEQRQKVWSNGKPAVMLAIQKQSDANTVEVCREVIERLAVVNSQLPRGVTLGVFYDTSMFINQSMANLGRRQYRRWGSRSLSSCSSCATCAVP